MQKLNAFKYSFFVRIIKEQVAQQPSVKLWLDISWLYNLLSASSDFFWYFKAIFGYIVCIDFEL